MFCGALMKPLFVFGSGDWLFSIPPFGIIYPCPCFSDNSSFLSGEKTGRSPFNCYAYLVRTVDPLMSQPVHTYIFTFFPAGLTASASNNAASSLPHPLMPTANQELFRSIKVALCHFVKMSDWTTAFYALTGKHYTSLF